MVTVGGVIPFEAQPGKGGEVARLLAAALPEVEAETGTPLWLVLQSSVQPDKVFLVDLFTSSAARSTHLDGEAAEKIFATVPPLLAETPMIHSADIIAAKGIRY